MKAQISRLGVLSLSADPLNTLMWSHYGDSHRGLTLGFSVTPGTNLAKEDSCRPVSYDTPQSLNVTSGLQIRLEVYPDESGALKTRGVVSLDDPQVRRAIFTKTKAWSYEREWRYVVPLAGAHPWPAPLTQVIFGANCSRETREHYVDLCSRLGPERPKFFEAYYPRNLSELAMRPLRI